ncbi:hypothetical protein D9M68_858180 [compost metagenome]
MLGRPLHDGVGIELPGDRLQHAVVVLLLQIDSQAIDHRVLLFPGIEPVPADLDGQPLARPVAGEPGNVVALGALVDQVHPAVHGLPRIVFGLRGGALRCGGYVAVDLPPGALRNHRSRRRLGCPLRRGAPCQRHQQGDDQATQSRHRRPPATRSSGRSATARAAAVS